MPWHCLALRVVSSGRLRVGSVDTTISVLRRPVADVDSVTSQHEGYLARLMHLRIFVLPFQRFNGFLLMRRLHYLFRQCFIYLKYY